MRLRFKIVNLSTIYLLECLKLKVWPYHHVYWKDWRYQTLVRNEIGETGTLIHCWYKWKVGVQPFWKPVWQLLRNLNIPLPYYTVTPLPREMKVFLPAKTCPRMFIPALSVIARNRTWRQCPSTGAWPNWGMSTQQNTTSDKKQWTAMLIASWMKLQIIMQTKRNQTRKKTYHMTPFI